MRRCLATLVVLAAACTPARRPAANHPADPAAPAGRLAEPPAALRPGVTADVPAPREPTPGHDHGHHH
jgi:hypothetical protein